MGRKLARDFGLKMRDKLRLVGTQRQTLSVTVGGIYDTGFRQLDDGVLFMNQRDGQSLLALGTAVSLIGLRVPDIYDAETRAKDLEQRVPFKVRSWIGDNPNLFRNLTSQRQTSNLILVMAVIAAGFGIASIGFIFQFHYLLPEFTVLENALMPCRMRGVRWQSRQVERMRVLLDLVGLGEKLDARPSQLPGGQQQRVAVVRALAIEPALVPADEPTGNLDSKSGRVVFDLMRNLSRKSGTALVMVTHDEHFALETDRVIRIRDGHIVSSPANG